MCNNLLVISLVVGGLLALSEAKKIPPYLTLCHANDPKINECFLRAVEQLRPHFEEGIPDLGIPPMNPLVVPEAGLNSGQFKANFKNIEIYHANEFVIEKLNVDLPKNKIDLLLRFPRLRVKSTYSISGRLLIFELDGHGPADGNFTDVSGIANLNGNRVTRKGKQYFSIDTSQKVHLKLGKPTFYFDRLFKDNEQLNVQTNKAINDNIVDIIEELRPVVESVVSNFIFGVSKRIFEKYSFDELFPK